MGSVKVRLEEIKKVNVCRLPYNDECTGLDIELKNGKILHLEFRRCRGSLIIEYEDYVS